VSVIRLQTNSLPSLPSYPHGGPPETGTTKTILDISMPHHTNPYVGSGLLSFSPVVVSAFSMKSPIKHQLPAYFSSFFPLLPHYSYLRIIDIVISFSAPPYPFPLQLLFPSYFFLFYFPQTTSLEWWSFLGARGFPLSHLITTLKKHQKLILTFPTFPPPLPVTLLAKPYHRFRYVSSYPGLFLSLPHAPLSIAYETNPIFNPTLKNPFLSLQKKRP